MRVYRDAGVQWRLFEGDRIIGIDNPSSKNGSIKKLLTAAGLITKLREINAEMANLVIKRGKTRIKVPVEIKRANLMLDQQYLYFSGATVSKTVFKDDEINNPEGFLLVHDIRHESKAEIARLKAFDLIRSVDGKRFTSVEALDVYLRTRISKDIRINVYRRSWSTNSKSTYILKKFDVEEIRLMRAGMTAASPN